MSFTRPTYVRPGSAIRAEDFNRLSRGIEELQGQRVALPPSSQLVPLRPYFHQWRLTVGGPDSDRLYVHPGWVTYSEILAPADGGDGLDPVFDVPVMPKLDGTRLDADPAPFFGIGGKASGSVWLVCRINRCGSYMGEDDAERVELTERGKKPEIENNEHAVRLVDFTLEDRPNGGKTLAEVTPRWRSDWQQWYTCDEDHDPSNDESWGNGEDSDSDTGPPDSDPDPPDSGSNGSDEEEPEPPDGCKVNMSVTWINRVSCFPAKPSLDPALKCVPGQYDFELRVRFSGVDPYGITCSHWAYGVKVPGAQVIEGMEPGGEYVWLDDNERVLKFRFLNAPACGSIDVVWRARGYAIPDPDGSGPETAPTSCCGFIYQGKVTSKSLPRVCGDCSCSSGGDVDPDDFDGDGQPNNEDVDDDDDGTPDDLDPDDDNDGIMDTSDPDDDNDGIPDIDDPNT